MKKWRVKLPDGQLITLESDTPREDLTARGYTEFSLEDITNGLPVTMFPIPQDTLTTTIEALRELAQRLEIEAANLAALKSPEAVALTWSRLNQAADVREAFEYLIHL